MQSCLTVGGCRAKGLIDLAIEKYHMQKSGRMVCEEDGEYFYYDTILGDDCLESKNWVIVDLNGVIAGKE